jgi:hypothetical protein
MAGRRPKPTHLKVVTGNPGKRKLNDKEPTPAKEIPSPQLILPTGVRWHGVG